jgi:hypothetical protein
VGDSAASPSSVITPPKGGGAIQGIGEKFSPDLYTGTGNFTVPIAVPLGRNGFAPQLSLAYSTGSGNGEFGLGWALSVPGVTRKTSKGIPRYADATDTFLLSGSEDLVPLGDEAPGVTAYRPRTEGLYAKILHHDVGADNYWEVKTKDGLISIYGTPGQRGTDAAVISDPVDNTQAKVFAWKLTRTTDPFGNVIQYSYVRDRVNSEGAHIWDQLYLSTIRYADYGTDPANPKFLISVRFTYADRPDHFSDCRAGFEIRTVQRCTQIDTVAGASANTPVRTYHLQYLDQDPTQSAVRPLNGASLLYRIRVEGHDGELSEWLPPLELGYTAFKPAQQSFIAVKGSLPATALADPSLELVDLFGTGLSDILQLNGEARFWRNLGGGNFSLPQSMEEAPAGLRLSDKGVQLLDANGDGRPDLLVTTPRLAVRRKVGSTFVSALLEGSIVRSEGSGSTDDRPGWRWGDGCVAVLDAI